MNFNPNPDKNIFQNPGHHLDEETFMKMKELSESVPIERIKEVEKMVNLHLRDNEEIKQKYDLFFTRNPGMFILLSTKRKAVEDAQESIDKLGDNPDPILKEKFIKDWKDAVRFVVAVKATAIGIPLDPELRPRSAEVSNEKQKEATG